MLLVIPLDAMLVAWVSRYPARGINGK
jgi:hypothetical protein